MKKILVVDPLAEKEQHINFNKFFLNVFEDFLQVTFLSKKDYIIKFKNLNIKLEYFPIKEKWKNKIGFRFFQIKLLKYAFKFYKEKNYDFIFFLSYETISFSLVAPKNIRVYVFEHINIDKVLKNKIKSFFYRKIPLNVVHVVCENYILKFIKKEFNKNGIQVPFPYYHNVDKEMINNILNNKSKNITKIFAPSGGNDISIIEKLKKFVITNNWFLITKGDEEKKSNFYLVKKYFENYNSIMMESNYVFLAVDYKYRVSGVAYEAISYCLPIIGIRSLFLSELKKQYPTFVNIINDSDEILKININNNKLKLEYNEFLEKHSFINIKKKIKDILVN